MVTTVDDIASSIRDFVGADVRAQANRRLLTAINDAYLDLATYHRWSYYRAHGRINTTASHSTGTLTYDLATFTATFTNALPGLAANGAVIIDSVRYPVATRASNTTVAFEPTAFFPQASLASATEYDLVFDQYVLPDDFTQLDTVSFSINGAPLSYIHPSEWMELVRETQSIGTPTAYTIIGDGGLIGRNPGEMTLCLFPAPSDAVTIDFMYQRSPRAIRVTKYSAGTVVATASSSPPVTGTNTVWTQNMIGSVLRISSNTTDEPTGINGSNPYEFELFIKTVPSATSLTTSGTVTVSRSNAKYVISDMIDIDDKIMLRAFRRGVERQMGMDANMETRGILDAAYNDALYKAIESDNRTSQTRSSMGGNAFRRFSYGGDG